MLFCFVLICFIHFLHEIIICVTCLVCVYTVLIYMCAILFHLRVFLNKIMDFKSPCYAYSMKASDQNLLVNCLKTRVVNFGQTPSYVF